MGPIDWSRTIVGIKGGGEMATGIAVRLKRAGFARIFMMEIEHPLAVRRMVSFSEAIHDTKTVVEDVEAVRAQNKEDIITAWEEGQLAVLVDPEWIILEEMQTRVLIDATVAKKNLGTTIEDAPLVIGLGPGFTASVDVHKVIETMRGHDLGRVIEKGSALANTGIPGDIGGHTVDRVLRAPAGGVFHSEHKITDRIRAGDVVCSVAGKGVVAKIDGVVRGLIREGTQVHGGVKIGDIDPRGRVEYCSTVSEKSRAIGGSVLEAILGASCFMGEKSS
jgi:xanthine dehydrogenase accessory factor